MTRSISLHDLPHLPARAADAHKGICGRVLVIAGSAGMTGAACLAASAALRAGAGLVRAAVPAELEGVFATKLTSALTLGVPGNGKGAFAEGATRTILEIASDWDAAILGPGIGRSIPLQRFVAVLARELPIPLLIDADGLNNLAADLKVLVKRPALTVLSPHPGEMGRLLGRPAAEVQEQRRELAEAFAQEHRTVVALKGHRTVVTDGERTYVNLSGNAGLATGGTGDVLSGVIGTLLAKGLGAFDAAALGVFLHGLAGDLAARAIGETGLTAEDVLDALPQAARFVER
ncbi:MAG: NAD(P)H-hydrate dehydratase [Planctomycetota bacterium]